MEIEDGREVPQLIEEVNETLLSTLDHHQKHYPQFRKIYYDENPLLEIKPLRWDIYLVTYHATVRLKTQETFISQDAI